MPDKFKNRYRIASTRLPNWDYGGNAPYFVTICTKDREHYFGKIVDAQMQLSKIGEAALDCWMKIPNHFPHCHLDESVIMPNHVHGIIIIKNPTSKTAVFISKTLNLSFLFQKKNGDRLTNRTLLSI